MKRATVVLSLCLIVAASTFAHAAPKPGAAKPGAAKPGVVTEIQVNEISMVDMRSGDPAGPRDGRSWTLRSDGSMTRTQIFDWTAGAGSFKKDSDSAETAFFYSESFDHLIQYIESSRLLDMKATADNTYGSSFFQIIMVRGGKRKSILVSDITNNGSNSPTVPAATLAGWVVVGIVRGLAPESEWKNFDGNRVDTGLDAMYMPYAQGLSYEESGAFDLPIFAVVNAEGREVAMVRDPQGRAMAGYTRHVLPPGKYRLVFKKADTTNPKPKRPEAKGYQWVAVPATILVQEGSFAQAQITLAKVPAAP